MKAKRLIASLLSAAMILSLAACSGNESPTGSGSGGSSGVSSAAGSNTGASTGEVSTVMVSYPLLNQMPTDEGIADVENALNQYLEEKGMNVRIDLDSVEGGQYQTQMDMRAVGGEELDVFCPLSGVSIAVDNNSILELDQFADNELAPAIKLMGEEYISSCKVNGALYALPAYRASVCYAEWACRKDVFDATGENIEDIKTLEDVERVLGIIHEQNPNMAAIAPTVGTYNSLAIDEVLRCEGLYEAYNLGANAYVFGDDTTAQDYYSSDLFKDACETAYRWNQAGYVMQDASVSAEQPAAIVGAGRAASYLWAANYCAPETSAALFGVQTNTEMVVAQLAKSTLRTAFPTWGISRTCKNPNAAATVLNMLYTDEYVLNTIMFGLEDVSWVAGEEEGAIQWPEGLDVSSVPYTAAISAGTMGSEFLTYCMVGNFGTPSDLELAHENMASAKVSPAYGFSLNTEPVSSQVASINNVTAQYVAGLLTGELNPDEYIPTLVSELESAGSADVIAEAQSQLDAWLGQQ